MNSAQRYRELVQSGDRVLQALAKERELDVFGPGDLSSRKWAEDLNLARRQVECTAESYAIALRTYRLAMLSELDPAVAAFVRRRRPAAQGRDTMRMIAPCRKIGSRKPIKAATTDGFPISTRSAKVQ